MKMFALFFVMLVACSSDALPGAQEALDFDASTSAELGTALDALESNDFGGPIEDFSAIGDICTIGRWSRLSAATVTILDSVSCADDDTCVAVGTNGAVVFLSGGNIAREIVVTPNHDLASVWYDGNEWFAVGHGPPGTGEGIVFSGDVHGTWQQVASFSGFVPAAVWGRSESEIYIAGDYVPVRTAQSAILKSSNGTDWSPVAERGAGGLDVLFGTTTSAIAGGPASDGIVVQDSGGMWINTLVPSSTGSFVSMWASGSNLFAVTQDELSSVSHIFLGTAPRPNWHVASSAGVSADALLNGVWSSPQAWFAIGGVRGQAVIYCSSDHVSWSGTMIAGRALRSIQGGRHRAWTVGYDGVVLTLPL